MEDQDNFAQVIMLFAIIIMHYAYSGKSFDVVSFPDPLPLRFKFSLAELGLGTRIPFDLRPCLTLYIEQGRRHMAAPLFGPP